MKTIHRMAVQLGPGRALQGGESLVRSTVSPWVATHKIGSFIDQFVKYLPLAALHVG